MREKLTFITLFAMLFGIIFPIGQPVISQKPTTKVREAMSAPAAPKFALLVGINDYDDKSIKDLNGTENDVKLMRELLSDLYGFKAGTDTKELLSSSKNPAEKPTQKIILDSFDTYLLGNARKYYEANKLTSPDKGATVIFYYSGHGSHLPDGAEKDESDGEDETIVPMDSDIKGTKDIRDDEFDKRFSELKKFTSNITFIFDSCHSGTITRGSGERSVERPSSTAKSRGDGTDSTLNENMDSSGESYITISGSLPNEKSQEDLLPSQNDLRRKMASPKMEMDGYLTYFLVQTLRETPDATYREVLKRVNAAVQKKNSDQHPQVEGDLDRVMFGSAQTRGKMGILISDLKTREIEKEGKKIKETILTIEAGKIVGAYPGGVVAIYRQIGDPEPIAVGQITEANDFSSIVKVVEKEIPENARIILSTPFFGNDKRVFALDLTALKNKPEKDDAGLQMIRRLSQNLEKNDFVKAKTVLNPLAKENRKNWDIAIVRSTFGEFKQGNIQPATKDPGSLPKDDDEVYYLASTNGNPIYNFYVEANDSAAEGKILSAIEKFVRVDNLRTLGNESSQTNEGLELKVVKLKSLKEKPTSLNDIIEDGYLQNSEMQVGDLFSFEVTNKTGNVLFPYIYSIETDGSVKLLYEPKTDGDKLLNNVSMKTLGSKVIARVTIPYGVQTFKLIAASQRFNGKLLESSAIARGSKGINPLEQILAQASTNTRDSELISFEFSGWATANLDIEIKQK